MSGLVMRPEEEKAAYAVYQQRYSSQPYLQTRPARTGWTRMAPDYKICLWGSSLSDWIIFVLLFLVAYGFLILFFYVLFELYLTNVEDNSVLYVFIFLGFVAAAALALVVHWGNQEREHRERMEAREAARKAAELEAAAAAKQTAL